MDAINRVPTKGYGRDQSRPYKTICCYYHSRYAGKLPGYTNKLPDMLTSCQIRKQATRATARVARTILYYLFSTSPCIVRATLAVALVVKSSSWPSFTEPPVTEIFPRSRRNSRARPGNHSLSHQSLRFQL